MSTNFISGLVSGIDTAALIDATIKAQSGPLLLLQKRQAESTARLSAWKSLEAILISMKVESDRLGRDSLWNALSVVSSNEEIVTAQASGSAALGSQALSVIALAASAQIRSQDFSSSEALVGAGTLTVTVGDDETELTIEAGTTLEGLAAQINAADLGATAALVSGKDAQGEDVVHLVVTGNDTGTEAALEITSSLAGGEAPAFTTIRAAQDAHIQFGGDGGLDLYSSTNTFEDLIEGLDVTVHALTEASEPVTIDVSRDVEGLKEAVSTFIDRYNTVMSFVNGQFDYDPETGERPPLLGDATLTGITGALRSRVTRMIDGTQGSAFRTLFSIGIQSGDDGTLTFDEARFTEALAENFDATADLFRPRARIDAEGLEWITAPENVALAGRTLAVVVTQAASNAVIEGDAIDFASPLTIDDSNDAFKISINGTMSELLHVEHGDFATGAELAAAIQAAIDGSEELDRLQATVSFEPGAGSTGTLRITSEREGSAQTFQLVVPEGSFALDLGFSGAVNVSFEGKDVAGTIDGIAATGDGAVLSIADEDSPLKGISFRVTSTAPFTANATFSEGVGRMVSRELFSLTDVTSGVLGRVEKTVQGQIDRFAASITAKQELLEERRARLFQRYARLESALAQLQSQGNFVAAQISSLSQISSGNSSKR